MHSENAKCRAMLHFTLYILLQLGTLAPESKPRDAEEEQKTARWLGDAAAATAADRRPARGRETGRSERGVGLGNRWLCSRISSICCYGRARELIGYQTRGLVRID